MGYRDDVEMTIPRVIHVFQELLSRSKHPENVFLDAEKSVALGYCMGASPNQYYGSYILTKEKIESAATMFRSYSPDTERGQLMRIGLQLGYMAARGEFFNSQYTEEFQEARFENPLPRIIAQMRSFRETGTIDLWNEVAWSG